MSNREPLNEILKSFCERLICDNSNLETDMKASFNGDNHANMSVK